MIRTRYAPSPTGFLHIGGARTALFSYLYAKKMKGQFIVRIEDTDIERNVEGGIDSQLNNLAWLGIIPDESVLNPGKFGPYKQTEKLKRYKILANKLVEEKKAYYCFCEQEELKEQRDQAEKFGNTPKYSRKCLYLSESEIKNKLEKIPNPAIRLKIDENKLYEWEDIVRGKISIPGKAMSDYVLLKSNGICTYNFGVVVDDHDMQITHVLRGEEHISNTPYQLATKEALGWNDDNILYGHLSIIVNQDGKKLSKRDLSLKQFIEDYKNEGYIPEAIFNFLALLGWSPSTNKELFSVDELINEFDLARLSRSPSMFDQKKMEWICSEYFKKMSEQKYLQFMKPFTKNISTRNEQWQTDALLLFKSQIKYAKEISKLVDSLINIPNMSTPAFILENLEIAKSVALYFKNAIKDSNLWTRDFIFDCINFTSKQLNIKGKALYMPLRYAISKSEHGPDLISTIYLIGKENTMKGLSDFIA